MTQAIVETYTYAQRYRALLTMALMAVALTAAIMYAVDIYGAISDGVALERVDKRIAALENDVGDLNARYLSLQSAITPDSIPAYGLAQAKAAYITRSAGVLASGAPYGY